MAGVMQSFANGFMRKAHRELYPSRNLVGDEADILKDLGHEEHDIVDIHHDERRGHSANDIEVITRHQASAHQHADELRKDLVKSVHHLSMVFKAVLTRLHHRSKAINEIKNQVPVIEVDQQHINGLLDKTLETLGEFNFQAKMAQYGHINRHVFIRKMHRLAVHIVHEEGHLIKDDRHINAAIDHHILKDLQQALKDFSEDGKKLVEDLHMYFEYKLIVLFHAVDLIKKLAKEDKKIKKMFKDQDITAWVDRTQAEMMDTAKKSIGELKASAIDVS